MGILNWLASKALGVPSAAELTEKSLGEICRVNSIDQYDYKVYSQPSFSDSRFKHRTYVGDAMVRGKKQGVVIEIDEGTGGATGYCCERRLSGSRDAVYKEYLEFQREYKTGGPIAGHFDEDVVGNRTKLLPYEPWSQ